MPVRKKSKTFYPGNRRIDSGAVTTPNREVSTKVTKTATDRPEPRDGEKLWKQDRNFYFFKVQNGEYRVHHKETGKIFHITSSKTSHDHHVEEEVIKRGKRARELVRYFHMRKIQSVQKCADKLAELIDTGTLHRLRKVPRPMKMGIVPAPPGIRSMPDVTKALKFKKTGTGTIIKVGETGALYLLEEGPDGWTIYFTDEQGKVLRDVQPVCWDESSKEDALIELQIFLSEDVENSDFTEDDIAIVATMFEDYWVLDTVKAIDGTVLASSMEQKETLEAAIAIEKEYYERKNCKVIVMISDEPIQALHKSHRHYIDYHDAITARRKERRSK